MVRVISIDRQVEQETQTEEQEAPVLSFVEKEMQTDEDQAKAEQAMKVGCSSLSRLPVPLLELMTFE